MKKVTVGVLLLLKTPQLWSFERIQIIMLTILVGVLLFVENSATMAGEMLACEDSNR